MIRTYSELMSFDTFEERFEYLKLQGRVGTDTFGHERYLNQKFYTSNQWREVRAFVVSRDFGCDLGVLDHSITSRIIVHHMNPMTARDLTDHNLDVLDPEFLITTQHDTHNAIHFGSYDRIKRVEYVPRSPGDTTPWLL